MSRFILGLLILILLQSLVHGEVTKSIFDDDWVPPPLRHGRPATPAAPAEIPGKSPKPAETTRPALPAPAGNLPTTPPAPAATVAQAPARVAVPSTAAQADAWKLIKDDLYKTEIANAKTPPQKVALAQKLLVVAGDTSGDVVGKYVLLAQAKELAIDSGDSATAFKCLNELGKVYDIDYPGMKLDLFASLAKTVSVPDDFLTVVEGLNHWADAQVKSDRYETATKACDIAMTIARKGGMRFIRQTVEHKKQIAEIEAAYQATRPAMAILETKPADPTANLSVGRFECFIKGNWQDGLPRLAKGADPALKALAAGELAGAPTVDAQMAVADGWWDLAETEKELAQIRIREHAMTWYTAALPNLQGLTKAKAEKRLALRQTPGFDAANGPFECDLSDHLGKRYTSKPVDVRPDARLLTEEKFSPPVQFVIMARTDTGPKNDVRVKYAADQIIFNWEDDPTQLRIDGGPANGRHKRGFGRIPVNKWVEIKLLVLPDSMTIYIDGEARYKTQADFSKVNEALQIYPIRGSNLKVRSITAQKDPAVEK